MHLKSHVSVFDEVEVTATRLIRGEVKGVQCVSFGKVRATDVVALVPVHFIYSREQGVVGPDVSLLPGREGGLQGRIGDLLSVKVDGQKVSVES